MMRLAGTVNYKTRPVRADRRGRPRAARLPDRGARRRPARPRRRPRAAPRARRGAGARADPYKRIAPPEYFQRLAGITVPRGGLVSLPRRPATATAHPSCSVGADARQGWCCHAGGVRGARRDLRPRVGARRRPVGPRAARRGVRARPRARASRCSATCDDRGRRDTSGPPRHPRRSRTSRRARCRWARARLGPLRRTRMTSASDPVRLDRRLRASRARLDHREHPRRPRNDQHGPEPARGARQRPRRSAGQMLASPGEVPEGATREDVSVTLELARSHDRAHRR